MTHKDKVTELLVHYLHTIPEQGDADEVAEIVELIYQDMDFLGSKIVNFSSGQDKKMLEFIAELQASRHEIEASFNRRIIDLSDEVFCLRWFVFFFAAIFVLCVLASL